MTIQENTAKNKLGIGLEKLTNNMEKDFNKAKELKVEAGERATYSSKVEKLKKFVGHVASIEISEIEADENIRQNLDTTSEEFKTLLESIAKNGVQQNLIVEFQQTDTLKGYRLKCVAGHRRLAAANKVGLNVVPCLIRSFKNEGEKIEVALAENLLREGLHVLDIADGYKRLLDLGWEKEQIQKFFDRNQKTVGYYLKMATWPKEAKELIRNNPEKLSGRVVTRKFACRKFDSDKDLLETLTQELAPKDRAKTSSKKITLSSKVKSYLETKRYSPETQSAIWQIMLDLNLIKESPKKC